MWLSGVEENGAWIQFEFEKVHKLHQMLLWNHNTGLELAIGFGIREAVIEYSVDGADWATLGTTHEFARATALDGYASNTTVDFGGAGAKYVRLTATSNWGGLLNQFGLSEVRFLSIPIRAREPSPANGVSDVHPDVTLAWRAGREAATHDVVLSTDHQAVIDDTAPVVTVTDASYSSALDLGTTYYWRVDEVNDSEIPSTWPGEVWNFSTVEYLVVEDFESYNDIDPPDPRSDRIFESWIDGFGVATNGALVGNDFPPYLETTIVHGGAKSMPMFYSNTADAVSSETTRTFATPQDWTKHGIESLQLWFYGTADNTGQLFVKINGVKIPYDGDPANLAVEGWQPWDIDLTTQGLNLQSVSTLSIGIDGSAAAGTLYFDDIRLYGPPVGPADLSLVAWWQLDNNTDDGSGNGHNGTVEGASSFVTPGFDGTGTCMRFGGDADRVTVDSFDVTGTGITLAAWINPVTFMDDARMISKSEGGSTNLHYWAMVLSGTGENFLQFRLRTDTGATTSYTSSSDPLVANEWTHVAVAWDASDPVMRLYKNGVQIDSNNKNGTMVGTSAGVQIGIGNQSISATAQSADSAIRPFDGLLDDVRVYDRGLSPTEIFQLAGQ